MPADGLTDFGVWFWLHVLEIAAALPPELFVAARFFASLRWNLDGGPLP